MRVTSIESVLRLVMRSFKSPFSQFSNTKYKFCSSIVVAISLIMKGWSNSVKRSFSLNTCLVLPSLVIWSLLTVLIATTLPFDLKRLTITFPYAPCPTTFPSSKSSMVTLSSSLSTFGHAQLITY